MISDSSSIPPDVPGATDTAIPGQKGSDVEFLNLARDRFKLAAGASASTRRDALDDLEFSVGEQWALDIKADRQLSGRPCLTVNVLPQFIRQVTNEQRQQRPSITVNPVGSGADIDTAEIFQGISRHIEVRSDAEVSYDYGFEYMVRCGFGYWRLDTDYADKKKKDPKDQEITVRIIRNPFCVYIDPNAQELDRSDAKWGFQVEDVPIREFKEQYPKSKYSLGEASLDDYMSVGDQPASWAKNEPLPTIRVAEYWYFKDEKSTEMEWAKITALDVIDREHTIWESVPLIGVFGDDLIVNGKQHQAGLVRFAKDPQKAKNFWTSAATEMIALAPKAPWLLTKKQISSYQDMWAQSNYRNMAYLLYEADPNAPGPPVRNVAEPPIAAMNNLLQLATLDLQATTGLYANSLGKQETANESGKAVIARQQQGQTNTLNYSDNGARAIRRTGRMLVNAIPKIYSAPKVQRIIKPDGSVKQVGIFNSQNDEPEEAHAAIAAIDPDIKNIYDIGVGDYDVTVSVGPSYQTKRQESAATQMALIEADPQFLLPILGDIAIGNMDVPGAQEMAKRLKKMLPPPLQDSDDPEAQQQQLMAQHGQLVQHVQQLSQSLQQATQIIQTKQIEQQGKKEVAQLQELSKQAIVKMQEATKLAVAQMNASKDMNQSFAENEIQRYQIMHDAAHEQAMASDQQAHEQELAQQGALQDQQAQNSDQTHELGMSAVGAAQQQQQPQGEE